MFGFRVYRGLGFRVYRGLGFRASGFGMKLTASRTPQNHLPVPPKDHGGRCEASQFASYQSYSALIPLWKQAPKAVNHV